MYSAEYPGVGTTTVLGAVFYDIRIPRLQLTSYKDKIQCEMKNENMQITSVGIA